MECSEVRLKLSDYIKYNLNPHISEDISYHLDNCIICQEEMAILKELDDILSMERPVYPGEDFTSNIMVKIQKERFNVSGFSFRKFPIINLGASLILTGLLIIFIRVPVVNQVITKYTDGMVSGAASINTNINVTTNQVETYLSNILNKGGK
jgi:hypothetical protein